MAEMKKKPIPPESRILKEGENSKKTYEIVEKKKDKTSWKSIKTALFDDTFIFVLLNRKFPRVAYHYKDCSGNHTSGADNIWSNNFDGYVTHWMPIPVL